MYVRRILSAKREILNKENQKLQKLAKPFLTIRFINNLTGSASLPLSGPTILANHFGLYEAITCAITSPNKSPGQYPITTAFQFNTSSSSSSLSSSLGCCAGGAKQLPCRGRPHRPAFPSNDASACPLNCGPSGISPLSWL